MSDTSEIFLDDVRVPADSLLGAENQGFSILMSELPRERLLLAIGGIAAAEAAIEWTVDYTSQRKVFGKPISEFQNTRFTLAQLKAEVTIGRTFVENCTDSLMRGELDATTAAMAKLWLSQLQSRVADACLQLHGGYGYMTEFPISRAWTDARVQQIYGGSNEVMKEIIARGMFGKLPS
jgi:alkylation response protein AidB-like acyl-CoA dehydrogenase